MLQVLIQALFPDRCVGCGARGIFLCGNCQKKIPPAISPEQNFITSIFAYQDFRIKRLIWMLKFKNSTRVAKIFASALFSVLNEILGEEKYFLGKEQIILVPIPLSKNRQRTRGYNQSELLCKEVLKLDNDSNYVLEKKLLKKGIETTPQSEIRKRSARLANLGDCFSVLPNKLEKGRTIILIDDVTTTGATLTSARKALRADGFKKVFAVTVAH